MIKRANKDLGRVIAMAYISGQVDEYAVENWPAIWRQALEALGAPEGTKAKLATINSGMQALLESREDQDEALHSINNGLLSSRTIDMRQFQIALQRYLKDSSVQLNPH